MNQRKFVRVLSLILAVSLIAGALAAVFVAWPPLLPIIAVAGLAVFLIIRARRAHGRR